MSWSQNFKGRCTQHLLGDAICTHRAGIKTNDSSVSLLPQHTMSQPCIIPATFCLFILLLCHCTRVGCLTSTSCRLVCCITIILVRMCHLIFLQSSKMRAYVETESVPFILRLQWKAQGQTKVISIRWQQSGPRGKWGGGGG